MTNRTQTSPDRHASPARRLPALLAGALLFSSLPCSARAPFDLDVAVPPGSPLEWGRAFPATTPRSGQLFPKTAGGRKADTTKKVAPGRTAAKPRKARMDVRVSTSFGLIRILTWDIAAHMNWVGVRPEPITTPVSGRSGLEPPPPVYTDALYWVCTAPLLRLMLHRAQVSRPEMLAHLIEIGDPVLAVLDGARDEQGLRSACTELRERIAAPRRSPVPLEGETPRETMLAHFVFDELLSEHAYGPEGRFGQRLYLLGDEVVPHLQRYCSSRDPLLARNAIAALARYRTEEAARTLLAIAAVTEDQVVLMRALSAVAAGRFALDESPLVKRLKSTNDEIERVALIGTLGHLESDEAVSVLLGMLRRERKPYPDRLLAILSALAHYDAPADPERVEETIGKLARRLGENPRAFRPEAPTPSQVSDRPDPPETRGRMLQQLAWMVLARLDPANDLYVDRLVGLATGGGAVQIQFQRGYFQTASLARIQPAVRYLYLEALADLGEVGVAPLRAVAQDLTGDPALRGYALAHLPWSVRSELGEELLTDERESEEVRIYAFDVLVQDGHPQAMEYAHALVEKCAQLPIDGGRAPERFLYLAALRALGDRDKLGADELLKLLPLVERVAADRVDAEAELRAMAKDLVERAAAGAKRKKIEAAIEALVGYAIEQRLNTALTEELRQPFAETVGRILSSVRPKRRDPAYLSSVVEAIVTTVTGKAGIAGIQRRAEFEPRVALEEEIVLALGRSEDGRAVEALVRQLRDPDHPLRATVALGLGIAGRGSSTRHLVPLLVDPDPFTRFCAYESLRHLTEQDFFADWMYGPTEEITAAANRYARWIAENR